MDDAALRRRVERIERRQSAVLAFLVGPYVLVGLWLFVGERRQ